MNFIGTCFDGLDHLMFPNTCLGCGDDLSKRSQFLCPECINLLPLTNFDRQMETPVEKVFRGRIPFLFATSFLYFTKGSVTQRLLHQLKYRGRKEIGVMLGRMMGESGIFKDHDEPVDLLIPLPLHRKKEKMRGYNQAAAICEGIAQAACIDMVSDAVIRISSTSSQTRKNRMERWFNTSGMFVLGNEERIMNKHVLLVDDVITTGATLEACGLALLKAEGTRLSLASLAYATL